MNIIKMLKIKKFVRKISKDIKVKKGSSLQCAIGERTIYVSFKINKIDDETFMDYVKEINSNCKFNALVLGILHEIGHIYTYDEDDEEEYYTDTEVLKLCYENGFINAREYNKRYIRLNMEEKATKWAIEFAMLNKKLVTDFQKSLG